MIRHLLLKYPASLKGGRLRTVCHWKANSRTLCSDSTDHAYFQEWTELGFFQQLWREALWKYEECVGLDCDWQAIDVSMAKTPLGTKKAKSYRPKLAGRETFAVDRGDWHSVRHVCGCCER